MANGSADLLCNYSQLSALDESGRRLKLVWGRGGGVALRKGNQSNELESCLISVQLAKVSPLTHTYTDLLSPLSASIICMG